VRGIRIRQTVTRLLAQGAAVIDVRSRPEFARGHRSGILNVPLAGLANALLAIDPHRWLVVCCASGTRSAIARGILRRRRFGTIINGGSWVNVARSDAR
jgi:phage shock protein E